MPRTKATAKKGRKPPAQFSVSRINKALRLLEQFEKNGGSDPEDKLARKFYFMSKKFFALKGRFKKKYTRKKKKRAKA